MFDGWHRSRIHVTEDRQLKQLVGILQSVDREERLRLMSLLGEQNESITSKINDCLYDYTDLLPSEIVRFKRSSFHANRPKDVGDGI